MRVAPEFAFDQGAGDLFVVRLAGNFANEDGIASLEYAVRFLKVPLILVLGHTGCGAVEAAIKVWQNNDSLPGHLPDLVAAIRPAVAIAAASGRENLLENAIVENVRQTMTRLGNSVPVLSNAVSSGKVKIAGGVYDLADRQGEPRRSLAGRVIKSPLAHRTEKRRAPGLHDAPDRALAAAASGTSLPSRS